MSFARNQEAPSPSLLALGKGFMELRNATPWLQEMPFAPVRHVLKHQADAWKRYFEGTGGRPRFRRGDDGDRFTVKDFPRRGRPGR